MKSEWNVPTDAQCFFWWDQYGMLPHIREHSLLVARIATKLAARARDCGMDIDTQAVRASALLHDLGKTYTITFGGNHSQIGGALVQELTGNPSIAEGVVHHVCWPGELDPSEHFLVLTVIYADKRVKHTEVVTLKKRYQDILDRYGSNPCLRDRIHQSFRQVEEIESRLGNFLHMDLQCECFS